MGACNGLTTTRPFSITVQFLDLGSWIKQDPEIESAVIG